MSAPLEDIAGRWRAVRDEVDRIARAAGRAAEDVTVVAVSKLQPAAAVAAAAAAGITDVAENYAQELAAKQDELPPMVRAAVRWHFIGKLQRNKVRQVVGRAAVIHAVDSLDLALEIDKRSRTAGLVQEILVAVNTGGEEQKTGVAPADAAALLEAIGGLPNVQVRGLMTMPPWPEAPEDSRAYFRALRELRDALASERRPLRELSMGTSGDYAVAIEEGATLVRIGTAIFGDRPVAG